MSIAKTTRPYLLTREAAADRIEALEAALREIRNWLDTQFNEPVKNDKLMEYISIANAALAPETGK